jgi:Uncharacterized protein conserved in bacteria (DUF2332)
LVLFAAVQFLAGIPRDWPHFRTLLGDRRAEVQHVMLTRRTQTNEPARCATLLPVLSGLPQPLRSASPARTRPSSLPAT